MLNNLYAIYDTKGKMYNFPFPYHNDQMAIRAAIDLRNDPNTTPGRHPEDFTLFNLGTYDDGNAQFEILKSPRAVCRFIELPEKPIIDLLDDEPTNVHEAKY